MSDLLHCEDALALAINDAICAAYDEGKATDSNHLAARIMADPKVRAIVRGERDIGRMIGWDAAKRDTALLFAGVKR